MMRLFPLALLLLASPALALGAPAERPAPPAVPNAKKLPQGVRMRDGDVLEVYVDAGGKIYDKRRYQGVIPRIHDRAAFSDSVHKAVEGEGKLAKVVWVGFQQMLSASRVFIKTNRVVVYTLYKPDPTHIVVEFPGATVPVRNNQRELLTGHFATPVKRVRIVENRGRGRVRVLIDLEQSVGYIYRQDGPYIFIDVER